MLGLCILFVSFFYSCQKQLNNQNFVIVNSNQFLAHTSQNPDLLKIIEDVRQQLQQKGYTPLHTRITDIKRQNQQGIDGLFKKGNYYYIVESKYSETGGIVNVSTGTTQQMSTAWLNGIQTGFPPNPNNLARIQFAAGSVALGNQIMATNPTRLLANIKPDGTVIYYKLTVNPDGTVNNVTSNTPQFYP